MSDPCKHLLDEKDARQLIPRLCAHFYSLGWVSGTGGGLSIRNDRIFVAPSGVQKELIRPDDIFELDANGTILVSPSNKQLKLSECNPLFQVIYAARNAGAVLHSHHISCSILTQLLRTNEFRY